VFHSFFPFFFFVCKKINLGNNSKIGYDIACDVLFIMRKVVRGDNYCMIRIREPLVPLGQVSAKVSLKKKDEEFLRFYMLIMDILYVVEGHI